MTVKTSLAKFSFALCVRETPASWIICPDEGRLVSREPSTAGSCEDPLSFTIWFAPVQLLRVKTGVVVPVATPISVFADETEVTVQAHAIILSILS